LPTSKPAEVIVMMFRRCISFPWLLDALKWGSDARDCTD